MFRVVTRIETQDLLGGEMTSLLQGIARVVAYQDFVSKGTLDAAFQTFGPRIALLFPVETVTTGHWLALFQPQSGTKVMTHFDSYGLGPEGEMKYTKQPIVSQHPLTTMYSAAQGAGWTINVNPYRFQDMQSGMNTCGRHVIVRLRLSYLNNEQYGQLLLKQPITPDNIVTLLTFLALNEDQKDNAQVRSVLGGGGFGDAFGTFKGLRDSIGNFMHQLPPAASGGNLRDAFGSLMNFVNTANAMYPDKKGGAVDGGALLHGGIHSDFTPAWNTNSGDLPPLKVYGEGGEPEKGANQNIGQDSQGEDEEDMDDKPEDNPQSLQSQGMTLRAAPPEQDSGEDTGEAIPESDEDESGSGFGGRRKRRSKSKKGKTKKPTPPDLTTNQQPVNIHALMDELEMVPSMYDAFTLPDAEKSSGAYRASYNHIVGALSSLTEKQLLHPSLDSKNIMGLTPFVNIAGREIPDPKFVALRNAIQDMRKLYRSSSYRGLKAVHAI